LSYNKLTSLSSLYCGYSSFRNLNVSNNLITSFSGATFSSTLLYADVSANKLTSSPTSVYKNSLTFLNISNNQIVADVSSIAYMSSLVTLDASFNNLTSNSFDPPTFPSNLNRLDLRRNKLTWSITRYFYWYFPYSLKTLRLDDNMITGSSKTMVSQLQGEYTSSISVTTLTYNGTQMIDLNECEIAASVYTALNGAPANRPSTTSNTACCTAAMTSLLGIYCEVKSSWTNPVQYYPHIQSINWGGLNMNGNLTVALAPFKNLIFLNSFDVGGNFLTGSLPAIIGRLAENINTVVRLVNLTLSANQFTGSLPSFTSLPALRLIDVSTNQITGSLSGFTAINENPLTIVPPSSVSINLANNQLSGSYPGIDYFFRKKFLRSQSFKTFNIDGNNFISQFDCQIAAAAWTALSGNVSLTPLTNTCNACCDGTKIVCDGDTITEINWQNQQLFGNAQFLFQNLYYLRTISLTQNRLTGPLPEFSSTYLVNLHLTSNGFDGSIPASWSNLSKLRSLRIGSNYISGSFPSSLFGIETLNYLDVSSNSFSGPLPSNPTPNKILPIYALDFGRNQFTGGIPETWSNLTYCQSSNLGNNQLSGNWTEQILRLPTTATLQSLHINKNSFTGSWFNFNSYFTGLSTLDISDNLITGVVPATATVKTSMNLYIGGNTLTGALPSSFMNCDSL
jgi:Leucine-rich repeat (LRR) protein